MFKMPKIEQFRHVVRSMQKGNPLEIPVVDAVGRVKLHGTNASVSYNETDGIKVHSKNNIITVEKDNAGFARFIDDRKPEIKTMMLKLYNRLNHKCYGRTITVFGEFCGKGINKGAAICDIDKSWFVFGIKIDEDWISDEVFDIIFEEGKDIYHLKPYKTITIDFNSIEQVNNEIFQIVADIEKECPIAKQFGIYGVGEGIVFSFPFKHKIYQFKTKGEKHSDTKVKKIKVIDEDKFNKIKSVANIVTPVWRLNQMYDETFDTINGGTGDIKKTGDYIRNVIADVNKEDYDIIETEGLTSKDVNKYISAIAKDFLFKKLDEEAGI